MMQGMEVKGMRRWTAMLMALVMLLLCMPAQAEYPEVRSAPLVYAKAARNGMVRVYLSSMGSVTSLDITVDGKYTADGSQDVSLKTGSTVNVSFSTSTGKITLTANGKTYSMGRELALRRHETSGTNGLRIKQAKKSANLYPGDLHLIAQQSGGAWKLYPIVHVYMENYLCGVVPYEMGNSAQLEALKAQAVAARTYTMNKMNQRSSGLYDVVDTTNDQVYYGNSDSTTRCTEAVMATKGIVLMNGSSLTSTWYTASNGGQTESAKNCWGSSGYGYLVVKDDPFDLQNTAATVKSATVYASFNASGQNSSLKSLLTQKVQSSLGSGATIQKITAVTPHTPMYAAPSRLYTKMDFTLQVSVNGSTRNHTVTCDIFSELESKLGMSINASKNELWSVTKNGENFLLQSRRYGHGVGMSQRGAMRMGALGYTYDQILGFYYENSVRMQHSLTHTILSGVTNEQLEYEEPPADITDPETVYATVNLPGVEDVTALRAGKSNTADLMLYLQKGTIVTPLAKGSSWTKVRYGNLVGYVRTDALKFTGTAPTSSSEAVTPVTKWATVSCNGTLNLRAAASTGSDVIATMSNGDVVVVFSTKNGFAKVQFGKHVGWASLDYLKTSSTYPGNQTESSDEAWATANVNMRSAPSMTADVLMVIPAGARVTVTSNDGSWCGVKVGSVAGYVQTAYLSFDGSDVPPEEPEEEPEAPEEPEDTVQSYATVIGGGSLNLREEPSTGAKVLMQIPEGARVEVLATSGTWTHVRYNGQTGWVMTRYLRMNEDAEDEPEGQTTAVVNTPSGGLNLRDRASTDGKVLALIPRHTRITVLQRGATWCKVIYAGQTGWVMTTYLLFDGEDAPTPTPTAPPAENESDAWVNTPSGTLNLREEPSTSAKVLAQIERGAKVTRLSNEGEWSRIRYNHQTGYVQRKYLSDGPVGGSGGALAEDETSLRYVNTPSGSLNLRKAPDADGEVLASIPRGENVTLLERGSTWSYVAYGKLQGWVMTQYLSTSAPEPARNDQPAPATPTPKPTQQVSPVYDNTLAEADDIPAVIAQDVDNAFLHEWCSEDATVVAVLHAEDSVTVTQMGKTWCKVRFNDHEGYVLKEQLRMEGRLIREAR